MARAYEARYAGLMDRVGASLAELEPDDADPHEVAVQITRVVDLPKRKRPFRVHVDPTDDGASTVNVVGDEVRARFYERIGLTDCSAPPRATPITPEDSRRRGLPSRRCLRRGQEWPEDERVVWLAGTTTAGCAPDALAGHARTTTDTGASGASVGSGVCSFALRST